MPRPPNPEPLLQNFVINADAEGDCLIWRGPFNCVQTPIYVYKSKQRPVRDWIFMEMNQLGFNVSPPWRLTCSCNRVHCIEPSHIITIRERTQLRRREGQEAKSRAREERRRERARQKAIKALEDQTLPDIVQMERTKVALGDVKEIRSGKLTFDQAMRKLRISPETVQAILDKRIWNYRRANPY